VVSAALTGALEARVGGEGPDVVVRSGSVGPLWTTAAWAPLTKPAWWQFDNDALCIIADHNSRTCRPKGLVNSRGRPSPSSTSPSPKYVGSGNRGRGSHGTHLLSAIGE
jgi:hypothetical protein